MQIISNIAKIRIKSELGNLAETTPTTTPTNEGSYIAPTLKTSAAAFALSLFASATVAEDVKIGILLGFTGPIESLTPQMGSSAELAIAEASDNGAVNLSTVGYGTGARLGRGIERVEAVHWNEGTASNVQSAIATNPKNRIINPPQAAKV